MPLRKVFGTTLSKKVEKSSILLSESCYSIIPVLLYIYIKTIIIINIRYILLNQQIVHKYKKNLKYTIIWIL